MSEQLSERGKDLVKYMPQAVNALADRLVEKLGERLLYGGKPQTNADRIRAMSDEKLAEWIYQVQDGDAYQKENFLPPLSKSWWLKWLKQESTNES